MSEATPDKTIFRRRRSRYTSISNTPLRDRSLTLDAVGFLACIMSLPEDWSFNRAWARKRFDIGREKLDRIIRELTAAGYIRREQEREADGRMGAAVYVFTDEPGAFGDAPNGAPPLPEKPLPEKPTAGQSAPTKDCLVTNKLLGLADDDRRAAETLAPCDDRRTVALPATGRPIAGMESGGEVDRRAEIAATMKQLAKKLKMPRVGVAAAR